MNEEAVVTALEEILASLQDQNELNKVVGEQIERLIKVAAAQGELIAELVKREQS